ncbi:sulfurtransferase [Geomesophilobacter sediminis]|uniref:Sulfurtransferase n=1 Tax=Geomesophilobacter sediminis TaxID=2798584 RepID=A0A8J7M0H0_9BACT|nr:rhodanese-like domain-containing protein [Geomesophilobacter sediminis]MBJ6725142.1 sulfurtransferase [Geomesophilobacter sediminis]
MKIKLLIAVLALSVSAAATALLSGCNSSAASAATTPAATAQLSDYFKSTDWVAAHASDANFVIVDTRSAAAYAAGHIPGAISIPRTQFYFARNVIDPATGSYKVDGSGNPVKIAYDIPTQAELVDILTRNGITPDTTVVSYDNDTSSYGPRVVWVLKSYGHAKAYAIDGGIDKWKDVDGRALSTTAVTPTPSAKPYKIGAVNLFRVNKADVAAVIDTANGNHTKAGYVISDVRTPSEYTGVATTVTSGAASTGTWSLSSTPFVYSTNAGARPGHIPYAKFSDYESDVFTDYINPTTGQPVASSLQSGRNVKVLKSATDIQAHFTSLGITPDKTIYNHCEGGFRSGVYTLIQLGLGYQNVYNYDGSWNEWSIQDNTLYPVVTGDGRISGP